MSLRSILIVLALSRCALMAQFAFCSETAAHSSELAWRQAVNCGPASLYVLLSLKNRDVSFTKLCSNTKLSSNGCTLIELQRVARSEGATLAALRCSLDDALSQSPVIAHLEGPSMSGHYVVLLGGDNASVYIVDPTHAEVTPLSKRTFLSVYSGTCLVYQDPPVWLKMPFVSGALLGVTCFSAVALLWALCRRKSTPLTCAPTAM
jgi:hypothetical protein